LGVPLVRHRRTLLIASDPLLQGACAQTPLRYTDLGA
jgi:hypothetical protein